MSRFVKRTGIIAGVHLAITLLLTLAMRQLPFDAEPIVWDIVYSLWMAVLQPLAAVAIRVERIGIRLPDSWMWGAVFTLNSLFVGVTVAVAWAGVLRIIRIRKRPTSGPTVRATARP